MKLAALDDAAWQSPWRARQVGEKVALSLGLVLTALVAPPWPTTLLVSLVSVVAIVVVARIRAGVLATAMAAPMAFLVLGGLSVAVTLGAGDSGALWRWGPLSISDESLLRAAALVGHGVAGTLALMVLATTTPMVDLLEWARRRHLPDPLVEVASLTYRMLWVLLGTTLAIREAQRARLGDRPAGSLGGIRRRWQAAGDTVGAVLVRSWSQAHRLEEGLAGRGYESALLTLPVERRPSPALRGGTLATLVAVWLLIAACSQHPGWRR